MFSKRDRTKNENIFYENKKKTTHHRTVVQRLLICISAPIKTNAMRYNVILERSDKHYLLSLSKQNYAYVPNERERVRACVTNFCLSHFRRIS